MNQLETRNSKLETGRWIARVAGFVLLIAIGSFQAIAFSRAVSVYETKLAERLSPRSSPQAMTRLNRAIATDSSNGWACWLLSKEYLSQAQLAADQAQTYHRQAEQTRAAGDERRTNFYELAEKEEVQNRDNHLTTAESLALRGSYSFNGIECFKQLVSIYLRQNRAAEAEQHLQIVTKVKPADIEGIERLGLIKLNRILEEPQMAPEKRKEKWNELRELCEQILRKHPYSANAYYYKAFIANKEEKNVDDLRLNVRLAYWMWQQNTGQVFFDPQRLEEVAIRLNLVEKPRAAQEQKQPAVAR